MDKLTQIAIDLKKSKYPQTLTLGDNAYLPKTKEYVRFTGKDLDDDYVRVPNLANVVNQLLGINYRIDCVYIGDENGEKVMEYRTQWKDYQITTNNIWSTLCKLWISSRGNND